MAEHRETAEDKTEERGHRAADYSERKGDGTQSPYAYDNRKD